MIGGGLSVAAVAWYLACDPDGTFDSGINKRQGDENIEESAVPAWSYPTRLAL
jgi:hypothetical protein